MVTFNTPTNPAPGRYELSSRAVFKLELGADGKRIYDLERANRIKTMLNQCSGTQYWHPYDNYLFTDGISLMVEECGAFWLLLVVFRSQSVEAVKREPFQVWELRPHEKGSGATLHCSDGNDKIIFTKEIPQTNFPLPDGIKLYFANGVLYLPSEH